MPAWRRGEVQDGTVVENTTAGVRLAVGVVARPIGVGFDGQIAIGGHVVDSQGELVVDGGLEIAKNSNQGHPVFSACTVSELR